MIVRFTLDEGVYKPEKAHQDRGALFWEMKIIGR